MRRVWLRKGLRFNIRFIIYLWALSQAYLNNVNREIWDKPMPNGRMWADDDDYV